ncbi:MAG: polymer-forming cytoskeletal protein [Nitrospira sp.]|nr:polymer-forming cytoskeletal protein [Nitrospira sp.]
MDEPIRQIISEQGEAIMWDGKKRNDNQPNGEPFTILGKDVLFKGIAHFEGTVQLDSCFEGEIHSNGTIVVGENAVIRGTINACTLITSGKIQGNVAASGKVQLLKPAVLIGDVQTPMLSIEDGAYFKGFTDMGAHPAVDALQHPPLVLTGMTQQLNGSGPVLIESERGS